MNDKLRVSVGEACKLILVQIHDEEFVGGREFHRLPRELLIEVGSVVLVFLLDEKAEELKAVQGKGRHKEEPPAKGATSPKCWGRVRGSHCHCLARSPSPDQYLHGGSAGAGGSHRKASTSARGPTQRCGGGSSNGTEEGAPFAEWLHPADALSKWGPQVGSPAIQAENCPSSGTV